VFNGQCQSSTIYLVISYPNIIRKSNG